MLRDIKGLTKSEIIENYTISDNSIIIKYKNNTFDKLPFNEELIDALEETMDEQGEQYMLNEENHDDDYFKKYYLFYIKYKLLSDKAEDLRISFKRIKTSELDSLSLKQIEDEIENLRSLIVKYDGFSRVHLRKGI